MHLENLFAMYRPALILLFSVSLRAASPQIFIQMSDPQLGMFANNANTLQDEANLRFAIASINRLRPAFVVVSGDLVNKTGDLDQIRRYSEILKGVEPAIPVYNVAGNHDVGNEPIPPQLEQYRKLIGKDYYSFDAGDVRGIVLNSSLIAAPQKAPQDAAAQEKWLQGELKRAQAEHVPHLIVFQHIPYFLRSADEPDQYFNIPWLTRRKYLDWFHQYGVERVFAGHYHRNAYGRDGEIEMVTTGPVGMPLGSDQSGFRVVRVSGKDIESHYYELGSIPNTLDPNVPLR